MSNILPWVPLTFIFTLTIISFLLYITSSLKHTVAYTRTFPHREVESQDEETSGSIRSIPTAENIESSVHTLTSHFCHTITLDS